MSTIWVVSDIHGDSEILKLFLDKATEAKADLILCAGDVGLESPGVGDLLANRSIPFLSVRGNCDSPWGWETWGLPIPPLYLVRDLNGREVFLTHGHRYALPGDAGLDSSPGEIIITGHTHVPKLAKYKDTILLNPGSIGRPRSFSGPTYATITPESIRIINIKDNKTIREQPL